MLCCNKYVVIKTNSQIYSSSMNHHNQMRWGFLGMLILCVVTVHAQDTIRLSLPEAENQFLQKNLSLLAEKYNIDIAKALVVQARLYTNPNFSVTGNIYNQQQKKLLDVSNQSGEYIIAVQQLIRVAGKRNKEIKLAETTTKLSEYERLRRRHAPGNSGRRGVVLKSISGRGRRCSLRCGQASYPFAFQAGE